MVYKMTMERTLRIGIEIEAESEKDAIQQANSLYENAKNNPAAFDGGDEESDWALCDDTGKDIIAWS